MSKSNKSKGKGQGAASDDFGPPLGAPRRRAAPAPAATSAPPVSAWAQPSRSTAPAWGQPGQNVAAASDGPTTVRGQPAQNIAGAPSRSTASAWGQPGQNVAAASGGPTTVRGQSAQNIATVPSRSTAPAWGQPGQNVAAPPGGPPAWGQPGQNVAGASGGPTTVRGQPAQNIAGAPSRSTAWGQPGQNSATAPTRSTNSARGQPSQSSANQQTARPTTAPATSQADASTQMQATSAAVRGSLRPRQDRTEHLEIVKTKPSTVNRKQGMEGRVVELYTNHFKLFSKIQWEIYHYRVDFEPPVEYGKALIFRLKQSKTLPLGGYLFDGTSLFLTHKLDNQDRPIVLTVQNTDGQPIQITIKLVGIVSKNESQFLQILNIIMKHAMNALNLEKVGHRDYFDPAAKIGIPRQGIELWPGYTTSIRQHEQDILMLAEIKHKLVRSETILDILNKSFFSNKQNFKNDFENIVLGMTVLTKYNNKTYRISEVDFDSTPMSTFKGRNDEPTIYRDYYKNKYNLHISNDRQPLLICKPKAKDVRGGRDQPIALIPEFCLATGYTDEMRSNFHLMREVAEHTRVEPSSRIQKLLAFNRRIQSTPDSVAQLSNWHLNMETSLLKLKGRVLPPQEIKFNGKNERYPSVNWQQAFRDHKMFASAKLDVWYYVYPKRCEREARSFRDCLLRAAAGMKFNISEPRLMEIADDRVQTLNTQIEECCRNNPRLILTILTSNAADKYSNIKRKCYVTRGVASQVVLSKTISDPKKAMSVATKVAIQINAKLGGAPWMVGIPKPGIMTIGYDVYHDSTNKSRSYGALVATMDLTDQTKSPGFFSTVCAHTNGEELSNNFSMMVIKSLHAYQERHGRVPGSIIIYRDGVGEGQTNYVYEHELKHLITTLKMFYKEKQFKMAFIIVSKRINTKFFTVDQKNPTAGTIVDDVVTLPERYDFFLVSQNVNQGTATPTNYNVLYDTMGISPDRLQEFTYRMCHLYYNWSGTTRVPATCQYAHKLAFLVGQYLHSQPAANLEQTLYFL